jgi:16S rRNA (uracil1498-N3)-methyltransferase
MSETRSPLSTRALATTPRLYVEQPLAVGARVVLPTPASHYLASVMRMAVGDSLRVFDDIGGEFHAQIADAARKAVAIDIVALLHPREPVADIWLCLAPIKRGRIDLVAEKACELGAAKLLPVITARTIVDKLNLDRLRANMIEAAEQCGRTALPELAKPVALAKLLKDWPAERALLFADEEGGAPLTADLCHAPAAILIGPEGGFTPAERDTIRAHPQAVAISLGPRILRAETAAIAALAVWQALAPTLRTRQD